MEGENIRFPDNNQFEKEKHLAQNFDVKEKWLCVSQCVLQLIIDIIKKITQSSETFHPLYPSFPVTVILSLLPLNILFLNDFSHCHQARISGKIGLEISN